MAPRIFPVLAADGKRIIFAFNLENQEGSQRLHLYLINQEAQARPRHLSPDFGRLPDVSSNGKRLLWASNRNGKSPARDE